MRTGTSTLFKYLFSALVLIFGFLLMFQMASALFCAAGTVPASSCIPPGPKTKDCPNCTDGDFCSAGKASGVCLAGCCKGTSFTDQGGQSQGVGDIGGIVGQIFKGIMDMMKGGGDKGGSSPPPATPPPPAAAGCTAYYTVTVPSSDPCATYVQPTSNSLLGSTEGTQNTASQELLNALGGGAQSSVDTAFGGGGTTPALSVSEQILNQATGQTIDVLQTQGGTINQGGTGAPVAGTLANQAVSLQSGTQGNIEIRDTGATVIANARDVQANTEIAGFYGGDTFGTTQPQGVVAQMCQSRPWAGSIVSFVIPPSFFDSLCAWRGYQVGTPMPTPAPTPTVIIQQGVQTKGATPPAPAAISTIPPEVDIWAVPAKVPLGARTSIFWNTKGVVSCEETSPDGSFEENSLSGGASTVPLSGATTFTISCLTSDGKPVTDYVTVDLAI